MQSSKPRVSYADFIEGQMGKLANELLPKLAADERPTLAHFKAGTMAWLIQRVIEDVDANPTTIRPHGESTRATLRRMQREPIGQVIAAKFGRHDIIEHCKVRRKDVCAATVKGDLSVLRSVINHAASTWRDCEDLSCKPFEKAKHHLVANQLIGKATRRTRLPATDEIHRLLDDLARSDGHRNAKIRMVPVVAFGLKSARRRGEVCRITHGDVDYVNKIYWVRDLKHPTKKKGNDKSFVLWPELEQIIKMQPRLRPDDPTERIFPYNGKSVGKRYIDAKKRLGIVGLRLHDNRGFATSQWLLKLGSRDKVRKLVTGHDSEKAFDIYDRRTTEDIMKADETVQRFLQPQQPSAPV
jgi:integrase